VTLAGFVSMFKGLNVGQVDWHVYIHNWCNVNLFSSKRDFRVYYTSWQFANLQPSAL